MKLRTLVAVAIAGAAGTAAYLKWIRPWHTT